MIWAVVILAVVLVFLLGIIGYLLHIFLRLMDGF